MKAYKVEILVIDHDELTEQEVIHTIEHTKYPNRCVDPIVMSIKSKDIGEWSDDHPLNQFETMWKEFSRLFKEI